MSARRAPSAAVFGPYSPEAGLDPRNVDVVYCTRCPTLGRRTALVQKADAIGRMTERCPACDGVAPARPVLPDQVFRLQALVGKRELLPPCPPGVLRCQSCAHPVVGDARLCVKCELPGLSKREIAQKHREREDREAAAAPRRPRPEMPRPLHLTRQTAAEPKPKPKPAAKPGALARAVAKEERRDDRPTKPLVWKRKLCACGCGETFQPTGGRSRYAEGHR